MKEARVFGAQLKNLTAKMAEPSHQYRQERRHEQETHDLDHLSLWNLDGEHGGVVLRNEAGHCNDAITSG